jgi:pre-mRNA-splicing factor SPF27
MKTAALAIDFYAQGQEPLSRKDEHLIDSLPYIDAVPSDLDVNAMIEEEMKNSDMKPSDYLKRLPPVPVPFEGHAMLKAELERVKRKEPMKPLDSARYLLLDPESLMKHDPSEWKKSLNNAQAQLEHQSTRISNLELMMKLGAQNWRAQCQMSEAAVASLEAELSRVKTLIQKINVDRKLQQAAAGSELRKAEQEYYELLVKNNEIEMASDRLESQLHQLRQHTPRQEA